MSRIWSGISCFSPRWYNLQQNFPNPVQEWRGCGQWRPPLQSDDAAGGEEGMFKKERCCFYLEFVFLPLGPVQNINYCVFAYTEPQSYIILYEDSSLPTWPKVDVHRKPIQFIWVFLKVEYSLVFWVFLFFSVLCQINKDVCVEFFVAGIMGHPYEFCLELQMLSSTKLFRSRMHLKNVTEIETMKVILWTHSSAAVMMMNILIKIAFTYFCVSLHT